MIVYLAGKYSGSGKEQLDYIDEARRIAIELWEKGFTVICPHLNSREFERYCTLTYDEWMERYLELMLHCDCLVMIPNWKTSEGAKKERDVALEYGMKVYEYPELPPKPVRI